MLYDLINEVYRTGSLKKINSELELKSFKPKETILIQDEIIEYVDFLISGKVYVAKFLENGNRIIADSLSGVQIFSLMEVLASEKFITANVIALNEVLILRIKKDTFLENIKKDTSLLKFSLDYLSKFSVKLINRSFTKGNGTPCDNILEYFYELALENDLPYKIEINKSFIADLFNVNIRSIFRYLKVLEEKAFITRKKGSVVITNKNLNNIELYLKEKAIKNWWLIKIYFLNYPNKNLLRILIF